MKKQSSWKKALKSKATLIILIVIALLVAFAYGRAFYRDYQVKQEISRLKGEVSQLEQRKIESMELLEYVASSNYVEEQARTQLNMKKKGEKVIVVDQSDTETNSKSRSKESDQVSNPVKWWYYFINKDINN